MLNEQSNRICCAAADQDPKHRQAMNTENLHLENWKNLSLKERLDAASSLAKQLPLGFTFSGIEPYSLGKQKHAVAFYEWNPTYIKNGSHYRGRFALIPGAEVVLGYDRQNPFVPTDAQLEAMKEDEFCSDLESLHWYLDQCTTPLRKLFIAPFLIE